LEAVSDAAVKEIASPGVVVRWKLGASRLEKTSDAGRTWAPVPPIAGVNAADLTAGSAPSPTTCWLVGRGGIVLLTTDGSTWRRLDFAEKTDLSAVLATDARNAVVTTVNGREYVSTDGGATWVRRLLQEN